MSLGNQGYYRTPEYNWPKICTAGVNTLVSLVLTIVQAPFMATAESTQAASEGFVTPSRTIALTEGDRYSIDLVGRRCLAAALDDLNNPSLSDTQVTASDSLLTPITISSASRGTRLRFSVLPDKTQILLEKQDGEDRSGVLLQVPTDQADQTIDGLMSKALTDGETVSWNNPQTGSAGGVAEVEGKPTLFLPEVAQPTSVAVLADGMCD